METTVVGLAWYKRENYARLLDIFEDRDKLHDTYDEWLASAEQLRKTFEEQAVKTIKVDIDPDTFPKWCKSKGLRIDATARADYASWKVELVNMIG